MIYKIIFIIIIYYGNNITQHFIFLQQTIVVYTDINFIFILYVKKKNLMILIL